MSYPLEDLGVAALGDRWIYWRLARHPQTGVEYALGSLSRGGFGLIEAGTWKFRQVRHEYTFRCAWAIAQAPNGDIYQCDYDGTLAVWDWKSDTTRLVSTRKLESVFTIDIAPDGRVYIPDYTPNLLYRFDPATGKLENLGDFHSFGQHARNVSCDVDGMVYIDCFIYDPTGGMVGKLVQFNPQTNEKRFAPNPNQKRASLSLPVTFSDGSAITAALGETITRKEAPPPGGHLVRQNHFGQATSSQEASEPTTTFTVNLEGSPLRVFSVEPGGDSIWGGTFIPSTLFRYTPSTGQFTNYGNAASVEGETYSMVYAGKKLYLASYVNAQLTCFDPDTGTPTQLGKIKEDGLPLQRPHGRALGANGMVYFCAHGGYGCIDSGLCRIDPATNHITRWLYPGTTFDTMTFVQANGLLLVSEKRKGEKANRFTFISPDDGKVVWSEPVIDDEGSVASWLDSGGDLVYGMHAYRATLFALSVSQKKIVAEMKEMRVGDHCNNALIRGLDGRIWGLTNQGLYAITNDLKTVEIIAPLGPTADKIFNQFGLCQGPDGAVYFGNGTNLFRVRAKQ